MAIMTGSASSMPAMPIAQPPANTATSTAAGLSPVSEPITRGEMSMPSSCWTTTSTQAANTAVCQPS